MIRIKEGVWGDIESELGYIGEYLGSDGFKEVLKPYLGEEDELNLSSVDTEVLDVRVGRSNRFRHGVFAGMHIYPLGESKADRITVSVRVGLVVVLHEGHLTIDTDLKFSGISAFGSIITELENVEEVDTSDMMKLTNLYPAVSDIQKYAKGDDTSQVKEGLRQADKLINQQEFKRDVESEIKRGFTDRYLYGTRLDNDKVELTLKGSPGVRINGGDKEFKYTVNAIYYGDAEDRGLNVSLDLDVIVKVSSNRVQKVDIEGWLESLRWDTLKGKYANENHQEIRSKVMDVSDVFETYKKYLDDGASIYKRERYEDFAKKDAVNYKNLRGIQSEKDLKRIQLMKMYLNSLNKEGGNFVNVDADTQLFWVASPKFGGCLILGINSRPAYCVSPHFIIDIINHKIVYSSTSLLYRSKNMISVIAYKGLAEIDKTNKDMKLSKKDAKIIAHVLEELLTKGCDLRRHRD